MNEEIKDKLREIVNKDAGAITRDEKEFLNTLASQLGMQKSGKSGCKKCWHDLAMQCWQGIAAREEEKSPKTAKTDRKYVLKSGVDLLFGSIRVNELTLTDELAKRIISQGFERKYFERCE